MIEQFNDRRFMTKLYGDGYLFEIPDISKLSKLQLESVATTYVYNRGINYSEWSGPYIELADQIAFLEMVLISQANAVFSPIEFEGMNCDTNCGWDGKSKRCFCGNRRVCWVRDSDFSFLNPVIYAEAY